MSNTTQNLGAVVLNLKNTLFLHVDFLDYVLKVIRKPDIDDGMMYILEHRQV